MAGPFGNGSGRRPDDVDRIISEAFERVRKQLPGWGLGALAAGAILALWLASGLYQVNPSEVGVVVRFGQAVGTTSPGLHWHLPWPIERVFKVPVSLVLKEEIGFRTIDAGPPARYRDVPEEGRMLTADGNIVELDFIVQYRIRDPIAFLFRVREPADTLRDAAESAMREVIGHTTIDDALTEGRLQIQTDAQELLQKILDEYDPGLAVTTVKLQDVTPPGPVQDAFKDVISAEQDRERVINEAEGFANDILPKARGTAAQIVNEAEGYAEALVKDAEGAAKRFEALYAAYARAPAVTRKRLYLETMEAVLKDAHKIILGRDTARSVLPLLPLAREATLAGGPQGDAAK